MNFIKTFLITLSIYIGINAVFLVIAILISPAFLNDIFFVVSILFAATMNLPGNFLLGFITLHLVPDSIIALISMLAILVPTLVAVIIGARIGDSGKISFLSWFLTAVISSVGFLLCVFLGQNTSLYLGGDWASNEFFYGFVGTIMFYIIPGIANGLFFGCFSFLFSKD